MRFDSEFDFIVSGAGSAGCAVAGRLAESGKYRVLLLEAGPRDSAFWIKVPMGYPMLFTNPKVNWMFESEPEPELNGRPMYNPRGKVLGGSSSINAMVYIRGQREDYDAWAAAGLAGWAYDDLLPCFRKSERNSRGPDAFHGGSGELAVSDLGDECHPVMRHFFDAAQELGLPLNSDFNGAEQRGFGRYQFNIDNGRRASASNAFLRPAMGRENLRVVTHAHAERLLIEDGRAVGLRYRQGGAVVEARAAGEVILCAGAIGTPLTAFTAFQVSGPEAWHPNPDFLYARGAGPLFDMGPYYLSTLVQLLGPAARVAARGSRARASRIIASGPRQGESFPVEVPTHVAALIDFEGGATAQSTFSFQSSRPRVGVVEIAGTEGTVSLPDPNMFDGELRIWRDGMFEESDAEVVAAAGSTFSRGAGVVELARAIRAGQPERASGEFAFHVLDIMVSTQASAESDGTAVDIASSVQIPPALPENWNPTEKTL